jgi:hypothetical protein
MSCRSDSEKERLCDDIVPASFGHCGREHDVVRPSQLVSSRPPTACPNVGKITFLSSRPASSAIWRMSPSNSMHVRPTSARFTTRRDATSMTVAR